MENNLELHPLKIGDPIPDLGLEPIFAEKNPLPTIDNYIGKPLLILFFNLRCSGCLARAVPYANGIIHENKNKINVVGIHSVFNGKNFTTEEFESVKNEYFIRFPFYSDRDGDATFKNYSAAGTPHWILVDKNGVVIYSIFGSDPNNALLRLDYIINEILNH